MLNVGKELMMADEDETDSTTPPSTEQVARQAIILAALTCRSFIEKGVGNPDAEAVHRKLNDWLRRIGVYDTMESLDVKCIGAPLGQFPKVSLTGRRGRGRPCSCGMGAGAMGFAKT